MPRIAEFVGIVVWMYHRDHNPAHFHVKQGSADSIVTLEGAVLRGPLSGADLKLVQAWAAANRTALEANWGRAQRGEPLEWIG